MTECDSIPRLDAYCDGELPPADEAAVDAHIGDCPACAARVAEIHRLGEIVARAAAGPGLSDSARHRLHRATTQAWDQENLRWAWGISGVAAAVLVSASIWLAATPFSTTNSAGNWEHVAAAGGRNTSVAQDVYADATDARVASWIVSDLSLGAGDMRNIDNNTTESNREQQ